MNHSAPNFNTYQLRDVHGQPYHVDQADLISAARECINLRFATGKELPHAAAAREEIAVLLAGYEHELFYALWLDTKHRILGHGELFRGTVDATAVYPREVVKTGLQYNASAVIFAHNHPSGITEPSHADVAITRKLKNALTLFDIRVLDHLIVGSDVTSMAECGLL